MTIPEGAIDARAATLVAAKARTNYEDKQFVFLEGGTSAGDAVSGWFQFLADSTETADDQNVISITSGGRLIRKSVGLIRERASFRLASTDEFDTSPDTNLLLTSSPAAWKSRIGSEEKPVGTASTSANSNAGATPSAEKGVPWANDTGYVSNAAIVATIVGGYDHTCNQIAGTIVGGGHNYIQYDLNGHSIIAGGSTNRIQAGRAAILAGFNNTVRDNGTAANYSSIINGADNTCYGSYNIVLGGQANIIAAGAVSYSAILAGQNHRIETTANHSAVLWGKNNVVDYHTSAVGGYRAKSEKFGGSLAISSGRITKAGDSQMVVGSMSGQTTSTTVVNLNNSEAAGWTLGSTDDVAVFCDIKLIGIDVATNAVAAYTFKGVMTWDGTTHTLTDGTTTASTVGFQQIVDNIGVAAVPVLAGSTGLFRIQPSGKAATTINWSAAISAAVVRV